MCHLAEWSSDGLIRFTEGHSQYFHSLVLSLDVKCQLSPMTFHLADSALFDPEQQRRVRTYKCYFVELRSIPWF